MLNPKPKPEIVMRRLPLFGKQIEPDFSWPSEDEFKLLKVMDKEVKLESITIECWDIHSI